MGATTTVKSAALVKDDQASQYHGSSHYQTSLSYSDTQNGDSQNLDSQALIRSLEDVKRGRKERKSRPAIVLVALCFLFLLSGAGIVLAVTLMVKPLMIPGAFVARDIIFFTSCFSVLYIGLHIRGAQKNYTRTHPGPPQLYGNYLHASALLTSRLSIGGWIAGLVATIYVVVEAAPWTTWVAKLPFANLGICCCALPSFIVINVTIERSQTPFATAGISKKPALTNRVSARVEDWADFSVSRRASMQRQTESRDVEKASTETEKISAEKAKVVVKVEEKDRPSTTGSNKPESINVSQAMSARSDDDDAKTELMANSPVRATHSRHPSLQVPQPSVPPLHRKSPSLPTMYQNYRRPARYAGARKTSFLATRKSSSVPNLRAQNQQQQQQQQTWPFPTPSVYKPSGRRNEYNNVAQEVGMSPLSNTLSEASTSIDEDRPMSSSTADNSSYVSSDYSSSGSGVSSASSQTSVSLSPSPPPPVKSALKTTQQTTQQAPASTTVAATVTVPAPALRPGHRVTPSTSIASTARRSRLSTVRFAEEPEILVQPKLAVVNLRRSKSVSFVPTPASQSSSQLRTPAKIAASNAAVPLYSAQRPQQHKRSASTPVQAGAMVPSAAAAMYSAQRQQLQQQQLQRRTSTSVQTTANLAAAANVPLYSYQGQQQRQHQQKLSVSQQAEAMLASAAAMSLTSEQRQQLQQYLQQVQQYQLYQEYQQLYQQKYQRPYQHRRSTSTSSVPMYSAQTQQQQQYRHQRSASTSQTAKIAPVLQRNSSYPPNIYGYSRASALAQTPAAGPMLQSKPSYPPSMYSNYSTSSALAQMQATIPVLQRNPSYPPSSHGGYSRPVSAAVSTVAKPMTAGNDQEQRLRNARAAAVRDRMEKQMRASQMRASHVVTYRQ